MVGEQILHYRVLEKIGEGSMGIIYKAEDTKLNRPVALKFLPPKMVLDSNCRERLLREARAAACLNHPAIVTIHEINQFDESMFIVMEYVEGEMLHEKLRKKGWDKALSTVPDRDEALEYIIRLCLQICDGLGQAHTAGIIHRDIKPQNILVTNEDRVKILDFGIAKGKNFKSITDKYCTLGTLYYLAPEQLNDQKGDIRTDIWSFGVLLYSLIGGELPFFGDTPEEVVSAIMEREPPVIPGESEGKIAQLGGVVRKMLCKEREQRFSDTGLIADALEACLGPSGRDLLKEPQNTRLSESQSGEYLQGLYFWNKRHDYGVLPKALKSFQEAQLLNSVSDLPLVGMADCCNTMGFFGMIPPTEAQARAREALKKAIEKKPESAEAYASLGFSAAFYEWNWKVARGYFQKALKWNAGYASVHEWYALALAARGEFHEALNEIEAAQNIDPLSLAVTGTYCLIRILQRHYREARSQLERMIRMENCYPSAHIWLGETYIHQEDWETGSALFLKALEYDPNSMHALADLGYSYGRMGNEGEAETILRYLEGMRQSRYVSPLQLGQIHLGMNNEEVFFGLAEEAFALKDPFMVLMKEHPNFELLHGNRRFARLLDSMGSFFGKPAGESLV